MSDASQESQEKTHEATPHKLAQAREKGDIAISREVSALASYLGLAVAVLLFMAEAAEVLAIRLMPFLQSAADLVVLGDGIRGATGALIEFLLLACAAALGIPALLVVGTLVAQKAVVFAPSKLQPKLSRISLISNAKQKYGPTGLMEFLKSSTKLGLVVVVLWFAIVPRLDSFVGLAEAQSGALSVILQREGMLILAAVIAISLVVAGLDFAWQNFDYRRRNRMSYQEVRDELKHTDGDPAMKGRRRERAQAIATNRMLLDVPKADVVITNPTHYAVALKWARVPGTAPTCLAKGTDEVAARIREMAENAGIPIRPDPPLARSIHAVVEVGQEIRPDHYKAAAAAILFADRIRKSRPRDIA